MKKVASTANFTNRERVHFLREVAKDIRTEEVRQAVAIVLRKDGAIGWVCLNPRGTTTESMSICDRAKMEMFVDMRERRRVER